MKNPKVSVIIPCYNLGNYIGETLESVYAQTYKNYEIIIVDDESNDGITPAILKKINHPKVTVLYRKNGGASAARNTAIKAAKGKYILPLDGDDLIMPTYLSKAVKLLEDNPDVGFVSPWIQSFEGSDLLWKTKPFDIKEALVQNYTAVASVFRRECWEESGGYDEQLKGFEDWDFWINIGKRGWKSKVIEEPLFLYRVRKGSKYKTSSKKENRLRIYGRIIDNHEVEFRKYFKDVILRKEGWIADLQATNSQLKYKGTPKYYYEKIINRMKSWYGFRNRKSIKATLTSILLGLKPLIPDKWKPFLKKVYFRAITGKEVFESRNIYIKKWPSVKPIISVIVPCYNYGLYLKEALDSILSSTILDYEIIIVNDGSTDQHTIEIFNQIHHPKIRIINQANSGLVAARNNGITQARGKYICCIDADDTIEPTYLEKSIELLESRTDIGFVYSWVQLFGDDNKIWETEDFILPKLMQYNYIPVSAVFRKKHWKKVGGYNPNMKFGYEDWDFWLSISELGIRGYLIPETLFNHRKHGRTMTNTAREKYKYLVRQLQENHPLLYREDGYKSIKDEYYESSVVNYPVNLADRSEFNNSKKLKVLYIGPWLNNGGAQQILLEIIRGLDGKADFTLLLMMKAVNDWHKKFDKLTKRIYYLSNYISHWNYRTKYILKFIDTHAIDKILISGTEHAYSILPMIKEKYPNIPVINLLHNDSPLGFINHTNKYKKYIDYHIGVNKLIANKLINDFGISKERVKTIFNHVDSERKFNPKRYSKVKAYKRFNLPKNKNIITWIGRLSDEKDPLKFVKLAKLFSTDKSSYFVMAGDGPLKNRVLRRSNDLTNFTYLGQIEEVPQLLNISSVLVMTSKIEGMPIIALEALSMGVPVVSTNTGNLKDIIKNKVNGFILEDKNIAEWNADIINATKLDRKEIRKKAIIHHSQLLMKNKYKRYLS